MAIQFLTTANSAFLDLQTGNARPFFYVEAIVSGVTAIIGWSYTSTNFLMDGGIIDREKPVFAGDRSQIFSSDVTIKVDNSTRMFSPDVTGSIFHDNEYLLSPFNYWGGFIDVSGTALVLQRCSFLLANLKLDSRKSIAHMRLQDKFKKTLDSKIGIESDVGGTALEFIISGIQDGASAIQSLLITGAGLTAGDMVLQTAGQSFENISMSEQSVAEAVSLIAEASDGYVFVNRQGVIEFVSNSPIFGTSPAPSLDVRESNWAKNITWEQTRDDRLAEVKVEFASGTDVSVISLATGITANSISIANDAIGSTGDAVAIASRTRDRFSGQITRLEIASIWAPSLDVGNIISVNSTSLGLISASYEVYKIQEEVTKGTMRIFCVNENRITGKWAFFSHATGAAAVGEHSAVFAGSGASDSGAWQAGWGFFAQTSGSETEPSFDTDGDNDGIIESAVSSSGVGGTGIETPFQFY